MRLLNIAILGVVAVAMTRCGAINEDLPTHVESSIIVAGDVAPDFSATTLRGEEFTLSATRGEVVLLVLFSHTCPDCKALFDDLMLHKSEIESLGVRLIAVSRGGSKDEIEAYVRDNGYDIEVIADSSKYIYYLYATTYVPRTYLIDRAGVVDSITIEFDSDHLPHIIGRIRQLI